MLDEYILNEKGKEAVGDFKARMQRILDEVEDKIPEGREKAIFKTKIEEACFFAVRAIASKDTNHEGKKTFTYPRPSKKKK